MDYRSLPSNALLFTSDATSMYTNIKTTPALECISNYLREIKDQFHHLHCEALIEALHIVFRNNMIKLGDTYWRQISGTVVGTPPTPPWATIFYGLHEQKLIPRWINNVTFYKCFIDDVIGIWLVDPDPATNKRLWKEFCDDMND